jgi:hypothetical protein
MWPLTRTARGATEGLPCPGICGCLVQAWKRTTYPALPLGGGIIEPE